MARPFVLDPLAGETVGYDRLWQAVSTDPLHFRAWCRPTTLADCFFNVAAALVADGDITLVDADFSVPEMAALGLDATQLDTSEQKPPVHRGADLAEALARVRTSSQSRVTLFTSGSTGLPKAVCHPLANLCRALRVGASHSADVWGFAYNPTHIAGVQVFLQALFNQNPLVNLFQLRREAVRQLIQQHAVTHLSATPTFYRLLLPADPALPSVTAVTLGGERVDAFLLQRLRPLFPNARFRNLYASTEAGTVLTATEDVFGVPDELAGRIRIEDGRLQLHRSLLGTFASQTSVSGDWYDTGDVVEIVSSVPLRFRIVSRDREWVKVGGNKVNPAEVVAVLLTHPQVREARVFGRANSVLGDVLCAEVVPAGLPPAEPDLRQFLAARLQAFKVPRLIRVLEQIDKTRTGKTQAR